MTGCMCLRMTRRTFADRSAGTRALALICRMPDIETLHVKNEKLREQEYKDCISGYSPEGWVKVLKTAYSRTKSRGSVTSVDKKYQMLLEHALYSEFSYALGMPEGQVPEFIAEHVKMEAEQSE